MNREREVKVDYPDAFAIAYGTLLGGTAYAIVQGPDRDSPWIGTGLTESGAWDDAYGSICFAGFAERIEAMEEDEAGEPTGSCDLCGVNLYGDEADDGLCDQCSWAASQG